MVEVVANPPEGTPTWVDLGVPDLARAEEFYGALFGWEFDHGPPEAGGYTTCLLRGQPVAALMQNPDDAATAFWWNLYLAVDDCDAVANRASAAGAKVVVPPDDVMTAGRMAILVDV
nr:VOC family protein [Micromonospora sp. DSM 115978]